MVYKLPHVLRLHLKRFRYLHPCINTHTHTLVSTQQYSVRVLWARCLFNMCVFGMRLRPGGPVVTTGRRSASTWCSSRSWTWSHTAAKTPHLTHHSATNTSTTNSPLSSCIMGKASARAITPPSVTTQREVGHSGVPSYSLNHKCLIVLIVKLKDKNDHTVNVRPTPSDGGPNPVDGTATKKAQREQEVAYK